MNHEVKVIAHRGASAERPEHTIAAYELAAAQGADGFECDIRLTRDGHAVCIHDRTVSRVSDGQGAVSQMTLAELKALNFGTPTAPARVLELKELLELVQDIRHTAGAGQPELFIETKHPNAKSLQVEAEMHRELAAAGLDGGEGVHLISFDAWSLWRSRRINPKVDRIQLRRQYHPAARPLLDAAGIATHHGWAIGRLIGAWRRAVKAAQSAGGEGAAGAGERGFRRAGQEGKPGAPAQYVWTVDDEPRMRWAAEHGVRWVATNRPGDAVGWLRS